MPTAADYRRAADVFRRSGAELADQAGNRRRAHHGSVFVGPVAEAHTGALAAIAADRVRAADALRLLATVCERRAEVCEQYADDLARWRGQVGDHRARAERRPDPPEPWVDV